MHKHCLVCLTRHEVSAPTCPHCGNASWSVVVASDAVEPGAPSEPKPSKRTQKRSVEAG